MRERVTDEPASIALPNRPVPMLAVDYQLPQVLPFSLRRNSIANGVGENTRLTHNGTPSTRGPHECDDPPATPPQLDDSRDIGPANTGPHWEPNHQRTTVPEEPGEEDGELEVQKRT